MSSIPPPAPSLPPTQITSGTCLPTLIHTTYIKEFPRNEDGENILHQAVADGQVDKLRQLLDATTNRELVNQRDFFGCTALRLAASAGHSDCLCLLLSFGADVNLTDIKAQTPLAAAVKQNNPICVQILLKSGADPDGDKNNLCTPLCWAVLNNSYDIVKMLLNHGCDVNGIHPLSYHTSTFTPLHTSITYGHKAIFKALLLAGANTAQCATDGKSLYLVAMEKHKMDSYWIQEMYDHGVPPVRTEMLNFLSDTDVQSPAFQLCQQMLCEPRSLMSSCRIAIRRRLAGEGRLREIERLPLPEPLLCYLTYH